MGLNDDGLYGPTPVDYPYPVRVFVSSTCYDLLDLRAEVESHVRDLGLSPVMSDRPTSDFDHTADRNSIETCLSNVRASDVFVCVLSQRYGASLKDSGFDDISASHLELREAQTHRKRIFVYVRDRLDAEFSIWKKDPEAPTVWLKRDYDKRLFAMLKEHAALSANSQRSNWYSPFRDSVDLKHQLIVDLRAYSGRALLASWLREGRLPSFVVRADTEHVLPDSSRLQLGLVFCLRSHSPAYSVAIHDLAGSPTPLGDCIWGNPVRYKLVIPNTKSHRQTLEVHYVTDFGATICDVFQITYTAAGTGAGCTIELQKKKLVRELPLELE
jgi:hypothetical protein